MNVPVVSGLPATKHLWRVLAIATVLAFAYASVLTKLGHDWWTDENYSHGLLIPLIIGFILWSQRERLTRTSQRPSIWLGLTAVVLALLALWAGTAGAELYMQRTSLVLMFAGIVLYFWGFSLSVCCSFPCSCCCWRFPFPQ